MKCEYCNTEVKIYYTLSVTKHDGKETTGKTSDDVCYLCYRKIKQFKSRLKK